MAIKDPTKLIRFIEAAITNPLHPVYQAGLFRAPALQHYAINVAELGAIKPEQWVKEDFQGYATQVNTVMELLEAEAVPATDSGAAAADAPAAALVNKADLDALKARLDSLEQKAGAPAPAPAPVASTGDDTEDDTDADAD